MQSVGRVPGPSVHEYLIIIPLAVVGYEMVRQHKWNNCFVKKNKIKIKIK